MPNAPPTAAPLGFARDKDYQHLRDLFEAVNYTRSGVLEALDITQFNELRADDLPILLRKTSALSALDCLIRLFLIETWLDIETFRTAIRPMTPSAWVDAGLIRITGKRVDAAIKLMPFQDIWVAFDRPDVLTSELGSQYVMGIGASSLTLANLTVRRQVQSALDLGTGCGVQALLAARHSAKVVAVDRNPRAIRYTDFNARLNAMPHLEARPGDLFQRLAGDQFDLIVTNPPFVISPEDRYIYRDSGLIGDEICRTIVRQAPGHLKPGGYLQMLCNWVETAGAEWHDHFTPWFSGSGCDVWVLRSGTRDPATYSTTWIRHTERDDPDQFAHRFNQWMSYYEIHGIESIGAGVIIMRRSEQGPNWLITENLRGAMRNPCGSHIDQCFRLQDFLIAREDDEALLREHYRISPQARLTRELEPAPDGWREIRAVIELSEGLPYHGKIDALMANILVCCDGRRPLREIFTSEISRQGIAAADIQGTFCNVARNLIRQGFMIPLVMLTPD